MGMLRFLFFVVLLSPSLFASKKFCANTFLDHRKSILTSGISEEFEKYYVASIGQDIFYRSQATEDWSILKAGWQSNIPFGDIVSVSSAKIFPDQLYILTTHKSGKLQFFTPTVLGAYSGKEHTHVMLDEGEKIVEAHIRTQTFDLNQTRPTFVLLFRTNLNQLYFSHAILNHKNELLPILGYKKLTRETPFFSIFTRNNRLVIVENTGDILLCEYPYKDFYKIGFVDEESGEVIGLVEQYEKNSNRDDMVGFNILLKQKNFKKNLLRVNYTRSGGGLTWDLIENYKTETIEKPKGLIDF
jgi:hypothetical protein